MKLLGKRPPRNAKKWHPVVEKITDLLVAEYGTPTLGNFRDPVKEIFYIVLSARTTEALYKAAHKRLWQQFPTIEAIANARVSEIRSCVGMAGLGKKRAMQIKKIAKRLCTDLGTRPNAMLKKLSAEDVFAYLCSLPGIGPKSALCVMMYSLEYDVFPVDTHVHRILSRIGCANAGLKHYQAQSLLPAFVPLQRNKRLHVGLVVHGRVICTSQSPECCICPIRKVCRWASKNRIHKSISEKLGK